METIEISYNKDKNNKLVIKSLKYIDALFDKIEKHCTDLYNKCDDYNSFRELSTDYTIRNPLKTTGFSDYMEDMMDTVISNISFSQTAQKKLVEEIVQNTVADLVLNAGEDLKEHIKQVTQEAYEEHIAPQDYWKNLQVPPLIKGENGAKRSVSINARCKMIARTETARTQNIANYVIGKERGATHWYALGFIDEHTCKECIEKFGTPNDPIYYKISDTKYMPPIHPNCRHAAVFVKLEHEDDINVKSSDDLGETIQTETKTEDTNEKEDTPKKELINIDSLYDTGDKDYYIYDDDNVIKGEHGKYYYKGLEVHWTGYEWYAPKSEVLKHNMDLGAEIQMIPVELEPIDTDTISYSKKSDNYLLNPLFDDITIANGKAYYKGLEVTDLGGIYAVSKEDLDAHNAKFGIEPNKKHIKEEPPKNEIIDTKKLEYDSFCDYYTIHSKTELDEFNGEYYYKGLKVTPFNDGFIVTGNEVNSHNKKLGLDPEQKVVLDDNGHYTVYDINHEPIEMMYIDPYIYHYNSEKNYYEVPIDEVEKGLNGKHYFNGAECIVVGDSLNGYGIVPKSTVDFHNSIFNEDTVFAHQPDHAMNGYDDEGIIIDTGPIKTGELEYDPLTDCYIIPDEMDIQYINNEVYYNGLKADIKGMDSSVKITVPKSEVDSHNLKYNVYPNPFHKSNDSTAGTNQYSYELRRRLNSISDYRNPELKAVIDHNELYMEDNSGKRWVVDIDEMYERKQDNIQHAVTYPDHLRDSVEFWGDYGHQSISNLLYGDSRYTDWHKYKNDLDKHIIPLLDEIREVKRQIIEGEYDSSKSPSVDELHNELERRAKRYIREYEPRVILRQIVRIDEAILMTPKLAQDTCFVRYGKFSMDFCEEGKVIDFDSFLSTSYEGPIGDPEAVAHFAGDPDKWEITILAEEGTEGIRLNDTFNAATWEREWLLKRKQKLKVINFNTSGDRNKVLLKVVKD